MKNKRTLPLPLNIQYFAGEDKTFTQEELNDIVSTRVSTVERKHDAYVKSLEQSHDEALSAEKTKVESLTTQLSEAQEASKQVESLNAELLEVKGQVSAFTVEKEKAAFNSKLKGIGVREERYEAFSKLLGDDKSDEALNKVLEDFPEFKVQEDNKAPRFGAAGNYTGANTTITAEDFNAMSYQERLALAKEKPEQYAQLKN